MQTMLEHIKQIYLYENPVSKTFKTCQVNVGKNTHL